MPYSRRAAIYDIEYIENRDVDFVSRLICDTEARVLEVPCGAGRLSVALAQRTRHLTIVDIEPAMVERAMEAVTRVGRETYVTGHVGDMRALALGRCFDLVVIPREALQLLRPEEGKRALAAAASHVLPGGRLVLDLATFGTRTDEVQDPDYFDPSRVNDAWQVDWSRPLKDGSILTRQSLQHQGTAGIRLDFRYERRRASGDIESWTSEMFLHRYDQSWIEGNIPENLQLEAIYGNYDRSIFIDTAPRMIALYKCVLDTSR
jgi:SAM-dependent methyltransferase